MSDTTQWQKSSYSNGETQCIEIATRDGHILVRESDLPAMVVTTTPAKLRAFLLGVKAGESDHFVADVPGPDGEPNP
ncbi:DUF397 domain-containing protein [Streptomyces sp. JNUCC 64]